MSAKRLLVTTDDFGMCHSVNLGIVKVMTQGIVTATNFLAPCPWFSEAADFARELGLAAGVHLCLTCDWDRLKWGPLTRADSLCDKDGWFHSSYDALEPHARDEDILNEYRAQISRVQRHGIVPTHVESHMLGSQMHGPFHNRVKSLIRKVCAEYDLIYTYDTHDDGSLVHFSDFAYISQHNYEETFAKVKTWTEPGDYHLICHAAVDSDELRSICSEGHRSREWADKIRLEDTAFCLDPTVKMRLMDLGFEFISVASLKKAT